MELIGDKKIFKVGQMSEIIIRLQYIKIFINISLLSSIKI